MQKPACISGKWALISHSHVVIVYQISSIPVLVNCTTVFLHFEMVSFNSHSTRGIKVIMVDRSNCL